MARESSLRIASRESSNRLTDMSDIAGRQYTARATTVVTSHLQGLARATGSGLLVGGPTRSGGVVTLEQAVLQVLLEVLELLVVIVEMLALVVLVHIRRRL